MKILHVIHGYPMRFNAGSEVYTQGIASAQAANHEVHVFIRKEDPFQPEYGLSHEPDPKDHRVRLHLVNHPHSRDRYRHEEIDRQFEIVLQSVQPDIIHIGHLNHLSTSIVEVAARRQIPLVFTLHDYWLQCPRGQFVQMHPSDRSDPWARCDGQEHRKCAQHCYARYFSGAPEEIADDVAYWSGWVQRRMAHVREIVEKIDRFIAPSHYLGRRFLDDMKLPVERVTYLDYGFDIDRLSKRQRDPEDSFVLGYIGTHTPPKGIQHLLQAFSQLHGDCRLRIFGKDRGLHSATLQEIADRFPASIRERIEWLPEYHNGNIVPQVLNRVDAVVVPSIWLENSPLVLHEAQQARVPVITADAGGMREFVQHEVNGLLFAHRDVSSLTTQMQRFVDDPSWAKTLGLRGYLHSEDGNVFSITANVAALEEIYLGLIRQQRPGFVSVRPGPWRITFDTNPDDCNLHCLMCEEHSKHSSLQQIRRDSRTPKRRMPIALIRKVLEESVGTPLREIIPSTMGEPLLYGDFDEILDLCKKFGVKLNLTTNGTFPRRGVRDWAERIVPVTSDVKISWNGSSKETYETIMVGTRWKETLDNLKEFIAIRDRIARQGGNYCRVTLQLTFLERNVHELPEMVRMAIDLGVDRVKGHHLWAHFKAIEEESMRRSEEAIERWNEAVARAVAVADGKLLPNGKRIVLENIYPLEPKGQEDLSPGAPCPFLGREAWVSAEGRFDPCCAPNAQRLTLGEFGNLHDKSLGEIWNGSAYQQLRRGHLGCNLCKSCNMRQKEEWA